MQVVYSRQAVPNMAGRKFQNPRLFQTPVAGATKVFIDGDWPLIAAAYKAAGVPVFPLDAMKPQRSKQTSINDDNQKGTEQ